MKGNAGSKVTGCIDQVFGHSFVSICHSCHILSTCPGLLQPVSAGISCCPLCPSKISGINDGWMDGWVDWWVFSRWLHVLFLSSLSIGAFSVVSFPTFTFPSSQQNEVHKPEQRPSHVDYKRYLWINPISCGPVSSPLGSLGEKLTPDDSTFSLWMAWLCREVLCVEELYEHVCEWMGVLCKSL